MVERDETDGPTTIFQGQTPKPDGVPQQVAAAQKTDRVAAQPKPIPSPPVLAKGQRVDVLQPMKPAAPGSRTWLWVTIFLALAIAAAVGVYFYMQKGSL
jgi:hypothetical protein